MFVFMLLVRATGLLIAAYFIWFAASRSEERMRTVGTYLALWTVVVTILYVIGSLAMPYMGGGRMGPRPFGPGAMRMHRGMMGPGMMGPGMMMEHGAGMRRSMDRRDGDAMPEHPPANAQSAPGTPAPAPPK